MEPVDIKQQLAVSGNYYNYNNTQQPSKDTGNVLFEDPVI